MPDLAVLRDFVEGFDCDLREVVDRADLPDLPDLTEMASPSRPTDAPPLQLGQVLITFQPLPKNPFFAT